MNYFWAAQSCWRFISRVEEREAEGKQQQRESKVDSQSGKYQKTLSDSGQIISNRLGKNNHCNAAGLSFRDADLEPRETKGENVFNYTTISTIIQSNLKSVAFKEKL